MIRCPRHSCCSSLQRQRPGHEPRVRGHDASGDPPREGDLGNKSAVAALGPLFRSTEEPCPLILLGAGASFRSGVPTAADAVKQIARLVYSERELRNSRPPERVKPSEWEAWLQAFDWFIPGPDRLAENFPLVVENCSCPPSSVSACSWI